MDDEEGYIDRNEDSLNFGEESYAMDDDENDVGNSEESLNLDELVSDGGGDTTLDGIADVNSENEFNDGNEALKNLQVPNDPAAGDSELMKNQPVQLKEVDNKSTNTSDDLDKADTTDDVLVNFSNLVENSFSRVDNNVPSQNVKDKVEVAKVRPSSKGKSNKSYKAKSTTPVRKVKKTADKRKVLRKQKTTSVKRLPRRRYSMRRRTYVKSYNEDALLEKHIKECLLRFYLES